MPPAGRTMTACALHLVSVQPWLSREAAEANSRSRAWHTTARARALLDAHGQPWRLHVAMGETAEQIACSRRAPRLFPSSSSAAVGLGFSETLLLGSLTSKLMHLSPRPVMVVAPDHNVLSAPTFDQRLFQPRTEFLELSFGDELS
jgi:nucleotide-binding universal stress UspA family protein